MVVMTCCWCLFLCGTTVRVILVTTVRKIPIFSSVFSVHRQTPSTSKKTNKPVYVATTFTIRTRFYTRYLPSVRLWKLLEKNRATDQRTEATMLDHYDIASPDLSLKRLRTIQILLMQPFTIVPYDGNSPEGIARQAWAKGKYRIRILWAVAIYLFTHLPIRLPQNQLKPPKLNQMFMVMHVTIHTK